jgi:hypothetical protein
MTDDTTDSKGHLAVTAASLLLAIALIAGLVSAGAKIYQRLPAETSSRTVAVDRGGAATLRVVVRNRVVNATLRSPLELYHFDLMAARREFEASPRLAKQFDDFLGRRMRDLTPVKAEVSPEGVAVAMLSAGDWWLHASAMLDTGEKIEWRLPIAVSDRDQAIELSFENAYERTKDF